TDWSAAAILPISPRPSTFRKMPPVRASSETVKTADRMAVLPRQPTDFSPTAGGNPGGETSFVIVPVTGNEIREGTSTRLTELARSSQGLPGTAVGSGRISTLRK